MSILTGCCRTRHVAMMRSPRSFCNGRSTPPRSRSSYCSFLLPCRRHSKPWTPARGGRFDEHKGSLIPRIPDDEPKDGFFKLQGPRSGMSPSLRLPMAEIMLISSPSSRSVPSTRFVVVAINPGCVLDPSPTAASYALSLAVHWSAAVDLRWFQSSHFCRRRNAVPMVQRPTVGR